MLCKASRNIKKLEWMAYYVNSFQLRIYNCLQKFFVDESESIIEMNDNKLSEQFDLALIETHGKSKILKNLSLFKQPCLIILLNYQKII